MIPSILDAFQAISSIPRRSGDEARVRAWLTGWAGQRGFTAQSDAVGNLLIRVPASPGNEAAPSVALQGHLDMVCEKTPDSAHDFARDPIHLVREGEWLHARGTTLGADNGIAIAMAMVAATDTELKRPALELLFTVDEETGLTGATALQSGWLESTRLINIDSEDEGVITVGCAGGVETMLYLPVERQASAGVPLRLELGGLSGGHSGVDIHRGRGNAIQLLARALAALKPLGALVADLAGGSAHNAIPRDASALVTLPESQVPAARAAIAALGATFLAELQSTDPRLQARLVDAGGVAETLTERSSAAVIDFLLAVPHGVAAMSTAVPGLVETSNNLARVSLEGAELAVQTSQRSSVVSRLGAHTQRIEAVARLAGGRAVSGDGYPPWQPDMASPLLARTRDLYRRLFERDMVVEIIHAGLECGIIGARYPKMDMISIGPTIRDPHCPDERLHVPTVGAVWDLLAALLAELC